IAVVEPDGTGVFGFTLGKSLATLGSTPATYFFQLLMPSPVGQALETERRLLAVANQRRRHESGRPGSVCFGNEGGPLGEAEAWSKWTAQAALAEAPAGMVTVSVPMVILPVR